MYVLHHYWAQNAVALLAEGVGRNKQRYKETLEDLKSPSSRRAWVEIPKWRNAGTVRRVALLAEGVGRNEALQARIEALTGRPPRGGRG